MVVLLLVAGNVAGGAGARIARNESITILPARAEYPAGDPLTRPRSMNVAVRFEANGKARCEGVRKIDPAALQATSCRLAERANWAKILPRPPAPGSRRTVTIFWEPPQTQESEDDGASYVFTPFSMTPDDYPADALRERRQGETVKRLTVDEDGISRDCAVIHSSGIASLDAAACRLTLRARFIPPVGIDGVPRASAPVCRIRWLLP